MQNQFRFHLLFNLIKHLPKKFQVKYDELVQPFFVIGSGRNGSTMLNLMLNQHSQLHLPSEQYFLGPSILKFHYYNYGLWRDMVKVILGELLPQSGSHTWEVTEMPDMQKLYLATPDKKKLQYLIDVIYRSGYEAPIWGDTTPLNTYYIKEIYHTFPKARYLFLIRDGRDVVASYKKGGYEVLGDLAVPSNGAAHWNHSITKYDWLKRRTNVHLVQYEKLVMNPKEELASVCEFLGLEFEKQMLSFHSKVPNREMYDLPVHQNLKKEVFTSSIGSYLKELDSGDLDKVMPILSMGLERFGYL